MKHKLKIYVICHKNVRIPKCRYLAPIQVGTEGAKETLAGMLHDNEGADHISGRNGSYCELTAMYWVWKNHLDSDYVGFFHYRRFLAFTEPGVWMKLRNNWKNYITCEALTGRALENIGLKSRSLEDFAANYDLLIPKCSELRFRNIASFYELYETSYKKELDHTIEIILHKYPEYGPAIQDCRHSEKGFHCNMFLMKKQLFETYCAWIFDVLGEVYLQVQSQKLQTQKERLIGYLAEFLTGIFICQAKRQGMRIKELQGIYFTHTDGKEHWIKAVFATAGCALCRMAAPLGSRRERLVYQLRDRMKQKKGGQQIT